MIRWGNMRGQHYTHSSFFRFSTEQFAKSGSFFLPINQSVLKVESSRKISLFRLAVLEDLGNKETRHTNYCFRGRIHYSYSTKPSNRKYIFFSINKIIIPLSICMIKDYNVCKCTNLVVNIQIYLSLSRCDLDISIVYHKNS